MSNDSAPSGRTDPELFWTGSQVLVWGGVTGNGGFDQRGGLWDPATDAWIAMTSVDGPTESGVAAWTGSELLVMGSAECVLGVPLMKEVKAYDPVENSWRDLSNSDVPRKAFAPAIFNGDEVIVVGGREYGCDEGGLFMDDSVGGGRFDPVSETWSRTSEKRAPETTENYVTTWMDNALFVFGHGRHQDRVGGIYDPDKDEWSKVGGGMPPSFLSDAVWTGEHAAYASAAQWKEGQWGADVVIYDPDSKQVQTANVPLMGQMNDLEIAWTGFELLLLGPSDGARVTW
jgi:N-acetylneuraminic acid mutarotase